MAWKVDQSLSDTIKKYVKEGLQRTEILDFVKRDFSQYEWSIRSLDRRMRFFYIYYNNKEISLDEVQKAVKKELSGPGKLLGYRSMHKKLRQEYGINVSRGAVYDVMFDQDPDGLASRQLGAKRKKAKGHFVSRGTNWVHSMDGHDKLIGYQNSTFPLAVYGCIDTSSRKILWLRVWTSNKNPKLIGMWYMQYLLEVKIMASMIRLDRGTETGLMATIHAFLRHNYPDPDNDNFDATNTVIYGPSTSNQIERWWKELHERLEKYFKVHLVRLKDSGEYNPDNELDRKLLAYVMIPIIQKQLDSFKDIWNSHRIRAQRQTLLPDGVPNHIHAFPQKYGLEECGYPVTDAQLQEVAIYSDVVDADEDYVDPAFRAVCENLMPYSPSELDPNCCSDAYILLKRQYITNT